MTNRLVSIDVAKQAMSFSIAHFTIFSSTERENLHGHNFQLECEIEAALADDGLIFDYGILKRVLREMCDGIDEQTVLPQKSPHLRIESDGDYVVAVFGDERLPFLKRDVTLLPIANTTVEEFAHHFLALLRDHSELQGHGVTRITVRVSSGPGQRGIATQEV